MGKYKLYYDAFCPVCNSFISIIKHKIDSSKIDFIGITTSDKNFKLILPDGRAAHGQDAIDELATAFPGILSYFWMLPQGLKKPALKVAYKVGSVVRNVIKKTTGCGCKKR